MDQKYSGCNIVESVVTETAPRSAIKKRTPSRIKCFLVRFIVSAALAGLIVCARYIPKTGFGERASEVIKSAFTYDVFGNRSFGAGGVFGRSGE